MAIGGYSYASTQINLPADITERIQEWSREFIPDSHLYHSDDDTHGRRPDSHVTVLYGLESDNSGDVAEKLKGFGPISFNLGKISTFECEKYDVVIIEVDGERLHKANSILRELPNQNTFPDYKPHVTIAYVKKGLGSKYLGNETFADTKIESSGIVFSGSDGGKVVIHIDPPDGFDMFSSAFSRELESSLK